MGKLTLYYGSESGILQDIKPNNKNCCDFGEGFYMGTDKYQIITSVCSFPESRLYSLSLDMTNLKVLTFNIDINWILFIAFNRGKLGNLKGAKIYDEYCSISEEYDLVVGYTMNEQMVFAFDKFFCNEITDGALLLSLSVLKTGKQYVAITEKACKQIEVLKEEILSDNSKSAMTLLNEKNSKAGIEAVDIICKKHGRKGMLFSEIYEKW